MCLPWTATVVRRCSLRTDLGAGTTCSSVVTLVKLRGGGKLLGDTGSGSAGLGVPLCLVYGEMLGPALVFGQDRSTEVQKPRAQGLQAQRNPGLSPAPVLSRLCCQTWAFPLKLGQAGAAQHSFVSSPTWYLQLP